MLLGALLLLNRWQRHCLPVCVRWKPRVFRLFSAAVLTNTVLVLPYAIVC